VTVVSSCFQPLTVVQEKNDNDNCNDNEVSVCDSADEQRFVVVKRIKMLHVQEDVRS